MGGQPLPSARRVSLATTETSNALDSEHTVLVMQMGQFIDHDLTHTPNHGQNCCGQGGTFPSMKERDPSTQIEEHLTDLNSFTGSFDTERCFPIEMDANDPFWKGSKTCMSMARSLASPGLKCSLEFRQQVQGTSFIFVILSIFFSSFKSKLNTLNGSTLHPPPLQMPNKNQFCILK